MSHTTSVKTDFKNIPALRLAAEKIGATIKTDLKGVSLYAGKVEADVSIGLKGWSYPVAINTKTGECHYDNYNGSWGDIKCFQDLRQQYGAAVVETEPSVQEMLSNGWSLERVPQPNGDLKIVLSEPQF